ncbi:MAG: hypothetical protein J3K34DRAFT_524780 [Monoraphidium minutum]|nr:MAG: hypothetical protein J3K34DRAFT_524780 [Monoraphidium minutum]
MLDVAALLSSARARWPDGYVALCVVAKDQHRDLRYWLEYHRWLGVDRVYVADHNSSRPMLPVIADLARSGYVDYAYFAGRPRRLPAFSDSNQWRGYHNCIAAAGGRHAWLGMLDADEFVVFQPPALDEGYGHSLPLLLARLEAQKVGALALNWVLFGSSGHKVRPPGGPLASYTSCVPAAHPESTHVKVIAHTSALLDMGGTPHEAALRPGATIVDADGAPSSAPKSSSARWRSAALYHYVTKSRTEFAAKVARGSGAGNVKTWEYWDYLEPLATATCTHGLNVSAAFMASNPRLRPPQRLRPKGCDE